MLRNVSRFLKRPYHLGHGKEPTDPNEYRDIYEKLLTRLEQNAIPLERTEVLETLLQRILIPEHAKFLSRMPVGYMSLEDVEKRYSEDYTPEEYQEIVDHLKYLGLLHEIHYGDEKFIYFSEYVVGWFEFFWMRDRNHEFPDEEFAPLFWDVALRSFNLFEENEKNYRTKAARAVVLEEVIPKSIEILDFETASGIVEEASFVGVTRCQCKTISNEMYPDDGISEKYPMECCFSFDEHGESLVRQGFAREASKEETIEIIQSCLDAGLVPNCDNQKNPSFICNCSKDACLIFQLFHDPGYKHFINPTRFIVSIDRLDDCIGCKQCVERCNLSLLSVENDMVELSEINQKLCVGCGNCVRFCPQGILELVERIPGSDFYYGIGDPPIEGGALLPLDSIERVVYYLKDQKRLNTIVCNDLEMFGMKRVKKMVKWIENNPFFSKLVFNDFILRQICKKAKKDFNML